MNESFFAEMKRYVRFGPEDEEALRALGPITAKHHKTIAEEFYTRLREHTGARQVFAGTEQVERLKATLCVWLEQLFQGPWDDVYFERRARIGRVHVKIALAQRYMFGAMNLMRISLTKLAQDAYEHDHARRVRAVWAIAKILDIELAIMLESYREAFVEKVQHLERLERSLLERRLAISEARYEEIVEKGEALIVTAEPDGRILLFNRRCEEITGIDRQRATGRRWAELFVPETERAGMADVREELMAGRPVLPWEGPVVSPDGVERRVRWHFTALPGVAAPILCAMGIDVTEEHALGKRTQQAERLASLGTMAAGLAHEIRNPLNAAHLQLTLVRRRLARATVDLEGALSAAELAESEMRRLAALVSEFLQFARPQPLRRTRADLRTTAEVIVSLVGPEAAHAGVELSLEHGREVVASFDDERMKQVLLNLVRNAVEATGRGGRVRVAVEHRNGDALLAVEDDGPGLPTPEAPIFEPFFTTKEGGTGLGLSIAHRIVSDHGGRIEVESRSGRTVFMVALPTVP